MAKASQQKYIGLIFLLLKATNHFFVNPASETRRLHSLLPAPPPLALGSPTWHSRSALSEQVNQSHSFHHRRGTLAFPFGPDLVPGSDMHFPVPPDLSSCASCCWRLQFNMVIQNDHTQYFNLTSAFLLTPSCLDEWHVGGHLSQIPWSHF